MRHRSLLALAVSLAAIAACAPTAEAETPPAPVATVQADSVRDLVTVSPIVTLTQDSTMAENTKNTSESTSEAPRKLDEVRAGGYFIGADGVARNADGEVIEKVVESAKQAPADSSSTLSTSDANASTAPDSGTASAADSAAASPSTPAKSRKELDAMSRAELQKLIDKEQLTVTGTGANGNVLKSDLVDALSTKYGATS